MSGQGSTSTVILEQELLGCAISSPAVVSALAPIVRPEHFSEPAHARLFEALLTRHEAGQPSSPATLGIALQVEWGQPFVAGFTLGQYVARLLAVAAPTMLVGGYATDLRDVWAMRAINNAAASRLACDGEPAGKLAEIWDEIDTIRGTLSEGSVNRSSVGDGAASLLQQVNSIRMGERQVAGATTGFADLDRIILGYRPGELVIVGARPGMGKTTFGTSSLRQCAKAGHGVKLFSLELSEEAINARILADQAFDPRFPLTHSKIRAGTDISDEEFWRLQEATDSLSKLPFEIDYSTRLSVGEIAARTAAEKKRMERRGVDLRVVGIDYLKFLKATDRYRGQRAYEVGEITAGLKEIAKQHGVCIVLLCQLNRGIEAEKDKRPQLQHLRESGDIESDADVVMFLYRDAYYIAQTPEFRAGDAQALHEHEQADSKVEIIVAKNRNGPTFTTDLFCDIGASALRNANRHYGGAG